MVTKILRAALFNVEYECSRAGLFYASKRPQIRDWSTTDFRYRCVVDDNSKSV